jgi:hypothetical protein
MATKSVVCPECEAPLSPGRFSCSECGSLLAAVAGQDRPIVSTAVPERGTLPAEPVEVEPKRAETTEPAEPAAPAAAAVAAARQPARAPRATSRKIAPGELPPVLREWDGPVPPGAPGSPGALVDEPPVRVEPAWPSEPADERWAPAPVAAAPPVAAAAPALAAAPPVAAPAMAAAVAAPRPDAPLMTPPAAAPAPPDLVGPSAGLAPVPELVRSANGWPPPGALASGAPQWPMEIAPVRPPAGAYLPPSEVLPPDEAAAASGAVDSGSGEAAAADETRWSVPDDVAARVTLAGAVTIAFGFLLPWSKFVIGAAGRQTYFDQWGLAGPMHLLVAALAIGIAAMTLVDTRLPAWLRSGFPSLVVAGLVLGLAWPYIFGGFGAGLGVIVCLIGAVIMGAGGILDLQRVRHDRGASAV